MGMNNLFWRFCEWFYSFPEPPPRVRTKPMEVLCVGYPRSGTESLQHALLMLGYDYTYHVRPYQICYIPIFSAGPEVITSVHSSLRFS